MNIISKLFENDVGIELGSANMRVRDKGTGLVLDDPAHAAIRGIAIVLDGLGYLEKYIQKR